MSFLYPLFLAAGVALVIPVLIHLFNLRKYKTVFFPHTRFLRNIQLNSRKQSQVRYKLLLATRLLFLASLILAFAQPFFNNNNQKDTGSKLQIIYLDNSNSMSVKKGARTVFDIAKEIAAKQVKNAAPGSKFIILSNDKPTNYYAIPANKAIEAINNTEISSATKTISQIAAMAQSLRTDGLQTQAVALYYYSDFQQNAFPAPPDNNLMVQTTFIGVPVQADEVRDIYIDTAYFTTPVLQTGKSNLLIVHTRAEGKQDKENPVLQLSINGQVKSAASINYTDKQESIDTLSFSVNDANWQKIELTLNDVAVKFDDTFRITARSAPNLSVLVINEGQPNPYIQAAFRAYNGFRLNQADINALPANWKDYNLVILNGITKIDAALGKAINEALQLGQSICLFPGKTNNFALLNEGLKQIGDITINNLDTAVQTASNIQQGNSLVKELFVKLPDNVQLPVANWHYSISAGLSANEQSVLSFRNGDPFLARYAPSKGQLYVCATSADLQSGNFPGSYFFAPFLYQMAMQAGSSSIYALTAGQQQPVYLPLTGATERNSVHLFGTHIDIIPPQRPNGAGLDVFIDQVMQQPGFYKLTAQGMDTTEVALNQDKNESKLNYRDISTLKSQWKGDNIKWMNITDTGNGVGTDSNSSLPLWKICVFLALIMLTAETFLLAKPQVVAAN